MILVIQLLFLVHGARHIQRRSEAVDNCCFDVVPVALSLVFLANVVTFFVATPVVNCKLLLE